MTKVFDEKVIVDIIAEQLVIDPKQVKLESKLAEDLGIQSVDLIKIIMEIEDQFDTEFEDIDQDELETVGDAIRILKAQIDTA